MTLAGGEDPLLLSHVHGDRHIAKVNAGECSKPATPAIATQSL